MKGSPVSNKNDSVSDGKENETQEHVLNEDQYAKQSHHPSYKEFDTLQKQVDHARDVLQKALNNSVEPNIITLAGLATVNLQNLTEKVAELNEKVNELKDLDILNKSDIQMLQDSLAKEKDAVNRVNAVAFEAKWEIEKLIRELNESKIITEAKMTEMLDKSPWTLLSEFEGDVPAKWLIVAENGQSKWSVSPVSSQFWIDTGFKWAISPPPVDNSKKIEGLKVKVKECEEKESVAYFNYDSAQKETSRSRAL